MSAFADEQCRMGTWAAFSTPGQLAVGERLPYATGHFHRGHARMLYIDDDADLRLSVRLALEASGWEVIEASSAKEGLEALGQVRP